MIPAEIRLKVMEAVQDDVNKGIVKMDSNYMRQIEVNPGDIVEVEGERKTAAIVDRAYPGDIGLNILRMDGNIRKNARTSIGELVKVRKAKVKPAQKVSIAPMNKGVVIKASPHIFKHGLLGKAVVKGDIVSLGGVRKRDSFQHGDMNNILSIMENQFASFGFGDLKFIVTDSNPKKEIVIITQDTEVEFNPHPVEVNEDEGLKLGINYEDIGGLSDEIKKVREMVELPLNHPEVFERLGIEPPKGVLLHGPPGTGKTLLAKAVASETNSHFILINGPEIMSKFYGESEQNLRKKFEEAEQNAPSIIFFDEIDAIATKREETKGDVEKRVVAQLLGLMDGLKNRGKVIVIAATNIPNQLDPALRRPGRFDREIEIGVPDKNGRLEILKIHTRNMPLLGSLYGDILIKEIPNSLKRKKINLDNQLNDNQIKVTAAMEKIEKIKIKKRSKEEELKNSENELKNLKCEFEDLNNKKDKADENLMYKILEKINGLNRNIQEKITKISQVIEEIEIIHLELTKYSEEIVNLNLLIEEFEKEKENIKYIQKELGSSIVTLHNLAEELKIIDDAKHQHSIKDPAYHIFDNRASSYYTQLDKLDLVKDIIEKARRAGIPRDQFEIAKITHGFVGADLSALAKEAAMIVLRRILPELKVEGIGEDVPIPKEILEKIIITQKDFLESLKMVRPSAMREVFVETPDVSWNDIGGLDDVKEKLKEAVEWPLKKPEVFKRMGIRPPRGILLYGPPGTGKTLLAKAVAKESEANFILINGPSLLSKWVGESEKAVRKIFQKARQTAPTILFFDEIDALVPRRGPSSDSRANEKVVNQMLTEMDGLETLNDVVVIAATNRPDIVDPALLRQGRFDRIIYTHAPNEETRKQIFEIYVGKMPISEDVDVAVLAARTEGYVGADIEGVCREAAMIALRRSMSAKKVSMDDFEEALDVVHASVDDETIKTYEDMDKYFSTARSREIKEEKASYVG